MYKSKKQLLKLYKCVIMVLIQFSSKIYKLMHKNIQEVHAMFVFPAML